MKRFITLNDENIVSGIRGGKEIVVGETENYIGEINQRMLEDGTFVDVPPREVDLGEMQHIKWGATHDAVDSGIISEITFKEITGEDYTEHVTE